MALSILTLHEFCFEIFWNVHVEILLCNTIGFVVPKLKLIFHYVYNAEMVLNNVCIKFYKNYNERLIFKHLNEFNVG